MVVLSLRVTQCSMVSRRHPYPQLLPPKTVVRVVQQLCSSNRRL